MICDVWKFNGVKTVSVWVPSNTYGEMNPITQVYCLCFNHEGNILVVRKQANTNEIKSWNLPGGTPEVGEIPEDTLKRELIEEADVTLSKFGMLGAFEVFAPENSNNNGSEHFYQLRYAGSIKDINPQTPDPDDGKTFERLFIKPNEFTSYIKWGELSDVLLTSALDWYKDHKV